LWALLFISPWLGWFLLFTAGPMIFSFGITFWETNFLNKSEYVGLANYREMLDDPSSTRRCGSPSPTRC